MCGIAGYANGLDATLLEPLVRRLEHRGPDEAGTHWDPELRVGLASTRLAILDIERGRQPMSNEDGSLWIVFNGEIFNAPELRASWSGTATFPPVAFGHRMPAAGFTRRRPRRC